MFRLDTTCKDVAILSVIQADFHDSCNTQRSKRASQSQRKSTSSDYSFLGKPVRKLALAYLYGVSVNTPKALGQHFRKHKCILPRKLDRGNKNLISYENAQAFHRFMKNYLKQHSLVLPGRLSGISRQTTEVLPTDCTKLKMYNDYVSSFTGKVKRRARGSGVMKQEKRGR